MRVNLNLSPPAPAKLTPGNTYGRVSPLRSWLFLNSTFGIHAMPDSSNETVMTESATSTITSGSPVRLRIWPAVLVAVLQAVAAWLFARFGTTNIHSAMELGVVPAVSLLLLLVWWLGLSRTLLRSRLVGTALFFLAAAAIVFSQGDPGKGGMLLARAMPFFVYGLAAVLLLSKPLPWPLRRWALILVVVLWTGITVAFRVDTIGGNLFPVVSWRWEPSVDQFSEALPRLEAHGTAALPGELAPGDWPAFRGAKRDGCVEGVRFSSDWSVPPRELWRRKIGPAWSAFILVGDYLFTQEQRGEEELVTCYRADTGEPVWLNSIPAKFEDGMGLGPRATPSYADGRLYTQGVTGVLQCLDAATGVPLWKRNLVEDAERGVPTWGFVSPLVVGDLVVVFTGGGEGKNLIAYHRASGEIAWKSGHGASGYASPHMGVIGGVEHILMTSDFGIEALDPVQGTRLWDNAWDIQTNPRCTQPVVINGDSVLWGATGTSGSRRLRVEIAEGGWATTEMWTTRQFRPYFNDGALHHGYYYGFDGERVACLDPGTGKRLWAGERFSGQLLLVVDMDALLVLSEAGEVVLVSAVPEAYKEIGRFKALDGKTWNHPVIGKGKLFVRNAEEAVCYELIPAP